MHSKHAMTVILLIGAMSLVLVLGSFISLEMLELTKLQTSSPSPTDDFLPPPRLFMKVEGTDAILAEVDEAGNTIRAIHTFSLVDEIADFTLFAVPQEHYRGTVYLRALPDVDSPNLIVYPLSVETGKLGSAVLNIPAQSIALSPHQERVSVITVTGGTSTLSLWDLASGQRLAGWELLDDEWLEPEPSMNSYSGSGAVWVNNDCIEHTLWFGNPRTESPLTTSERRGYCIQTHQHFH